jgi:hypothetical protein
MGRWRVGDFECIKREIICGAWRTKQNAERGARGTNGSSLLV